MVEREEQELVFIAARAEEIKTGLDARYTREELLRPLSTRCVHALVAATTAATAAKLRALSARVEQLEAGGVRYAGTWQRALPYRKGTVVTSSGSMWVALRDVAEGEQPGKVLDAWQLATKGGKPMKRTPEGATST